MYDWIISRYLNSQCCSSYFQFGLRQENTNGYSDPMGKSPYATKEKVSTLVSMYEFLQSLQAKKPKKIAWTELFEVQFYVLLLWSIPFRFFFLVDILKLN